MISAWCVMVSERKPLLVRKERSVAATGLSVVYIGMQSSYAVRDKS